MRSYCDSLMHRLVEKDYLQTNLHLFRLRHHKIIFPLITRDVRRRPLLRIPAFFERRNEHKAILWQVLREAIKELHLQLKIG